MSLLNRKGCGTRSPRHARLAQNPERQVWKRSDLAYVWRESGRPQGLLDLNVISNSRFPSFESILRPGDGLSARRRVVIFLVDVLLACCAIALVITIVWFPTIWMVHAYHEHQEVNASANSIARWPQGRVVSEYHRAQAYNNRIAASDQRSLGEFSDPFGSLGPNGKRAKPQSEKDRDYRSLLNDGEGDGIMGTVRIPKVSVNMPIYHGTSDDVLLHGAGHLYGTSLPVGGESTNAVLSGHRGLSSALLFTRLDELKKGDIFYVQTLNRTMGYRVVGIHIIDPDDTHYYRVVPGQDLVTLMTCTPYGVNTQRLVITGTRQAIPDPIPDPDNAQGDPLPVAVLAGLVVLVVGLIAVKRSHHGLVAAHHHLSEPPHFRLKWVPERIDPQDILY